MVGGMGLADQKYPSRLKGLSYESFLLTKTGGAGMQPHGAGGRCTPLSLLLANVITLDSAWASVTTPH
eukprot:COSAG03_NODE_1981_length_3263_cov_4.269595_1_plen_67_part_10